MSYVERKKLRYGMAIGLCEYCSQNIHMVRDFQSGLMMSSGYIGYYDAWDRTLRVFVFEGPDSRNEALKDARSIGFRSAGTVDGELFISNSSLRRSHLKNVSRKDQFYKEYYR